jgi:hypothetical protein
LSTDWWLIATNHRKRLTTAHARHLETTGTGDETILGGESEGTTTTTIVSSAIAARAQGETDVITTVDATNPDGESAVVVQTAIVTVGENGAVIDIGGVTQTVAAK